MQWKKFLLTHLLLFQMMFFLIWNSMFIPLWSILCTEKFLLLKLKRQIHMEFTLLILRKLSFKNRKNEALLNVYLILIVLQHLFFLTRSSYLRIQTTLKESSFHIQGLKRITQNFKISQSQYLSKDQASLFHWTKRKQKEYNRFDTL